ncbi:MAG: methylmalonyl-CoA mutase family protein [Desertimonas sp.]
MPDDTLADRSSATIPLAEGLTPSRGAWQHATAAVLRKSKKLADDAPDEAAWEALTTTTLDGVRITPLGTPELTAGLPDGGLPGQSPFVRGTMPRRDHGAWDIRAWYTDPDPERTADDVMADLDNGVNSLWFTLGPDGLDPAALAGVLEPVLIDLAPVVLDAPHDPLGAARALVDVIARKPAIAHPGTNLGADPLGNALRGRGVTDMAVALDVARQARDAGVKALVVDGTAVHDAGGSDVQELAWLLAAGTTYLRALHDAGIDLNAAAGLLEFRIAATVEQFPTIAKFRAARRLWARVTELSGVATQARGMVQHAVTSRPMMSSYDPYVNMLRTSVAAFAAGVGGATSVTVLPFDEPLGLPEAFGRRIARNTSSLLISESHVAAVTDPGGGSHLIESLSDELARSAWDAFGRIETAGGAERALAAGTITDDIERIVADRNRLIARRRWPLTGVSEFPNLHEELPERRPYPTAPEAHRYAAAFETMRDERAAVPVFLATMGSVAQHTARATFAANLFAAGGIDTVTAGATGDVADVIAAYDGAPVACLCGPDDLYAAWGAALVTALRDAGARHVILAGKADVGADITAAAGLDALEFLRSTRQELGA